MQLLPIMQILLYTRSGPHPQQLHAITNKLETNLLNVSHSKMKISVITNILIMKFYEYIGVISIDILTQNIDRYFDTKYR